MEGFQLALFADNPHLVPEGLQGANIHVPSVVGYVVQTSQEAQTQVSNDVPDEIQQSNPQVRNGNLSDERDAIVQSHVQVTNGNVWAERCIESRDPKQFNKDWFQYMPHEGETSRLFFLSCCTIYP